jgi:hypothetical protein
MTTPDELSPETTITYPAVRDFRINVPDEELVDLRRRAAATKCPLIAAAFLALRP